MQSDKCRGKYGDFLSNHLQPQGGKSFWPLRAVPAKPYWAATVLEVLHKVQWTKHRAKLCLEAGEPGFEPCLPLPAVWPWEGHLPFWVLVFLDYKMRQPQTSQGGWEKMEYGLLFDVWIWNLRGRTGPPAPTVMKVKLLTDTYLSRVRESSVYSGRSFKSLGEAEIWCRLMGSAWPSLPTTSRPVSPR